MGGGGGSSKGFAGAKGGGKSKGGKPLDSPDAGEKIFVGGLPKSASQDSIWNFFSQFGNCTNVDLKYDEGGGFRGFGFVTFANEQAAQAALANGPNNMFEGKWIDVKPAMRGEGGKGGGKGGGDKGGCKGGGDKGGCKGGKGDW